jgi:hypothetical protein
MLITNKLAHLCLTNLYTQVKYSALIHHDKYALVFVPGNSMHPSLIFVTETHYKYAGTFVPDKPLQPSQIFSAD